MRLPAFSFSFLPLSASILGCETSGDSAPAIAVRDSAGIQIVESARPLWRAGDEWKAGELLVVIGATMGDSPGQQLEQVVGATRLTDGTIVVADAGARALLRYDAAGSYVGAIGGAGEGPGEFRALSWAGRAGDSLVTWDRALGRVSVFAPTGMTAREYRPTLTEPPMTLEVQGGLDGGALLMARAPGLVSREGSPGIQRQPIHGWLIAAGGEEIRSFGPFPGEALYLDAGTRSFTSIPLGAKTRFAAAGNTVYVVDTERFAARTYDSTGKLVRIFRRQHTPRAPSAEEVEADIDERMKELPTNLRNREGYRRRFREAPLPEWMPAVREVHVDTEQHVWLEAAGGVADSAAAWSVFDHDGRWLGDVMLPRAVSMLEIGPDYILALLEDELDVQGVMLLRLDRR